MRFQDWIEMVSCPMDDGSPLYLYVVKGERLMLVDSGLARTPEQYILPYLQRTGRSMSQLQSVVITHAHVDHIGGNSALYRANSDIHFYIHRDDLEWAENRRRHFMELYEALPGQWEPDDRYRLEVLRHCGEDVPITHALVEGELVCTGAVAFTCMHAPGHSRGHLLLYQPEMKAAICGDLLQQAGTGPVGKRVFPLYQQVESYVQTLDRFEALQLQTAATSHFGVLEGEHISEAIRKSRDFVRVHNSRLVKMLQEAAEPLTLKELTQRLHMTYYPEYELGLQIHATTYAHCQHLRDRQLVHRCLHRGQMTWKAGIA
ncbi:MBL fold metallo-hydrolase [Paenibacillus sp. YYML68]|uniref:MBL fold metallo-hydrolase n=1 Tax=Paenibacillus sp. YYML68 TaxID=2909250 RepID=UPI0024901A54|nr:MBL fold metallo-hydrolase [Paenibacillus sp. YYML68]